VAANPESSSSNSSKEAQDDAAADTSHDALQPPVKRKRGRPRGTFGKKRAATIRMRVSTADATDTDAQVDGSQESLPKTRATRASSRRTYNEDSSENEADVDTLRRRGKRRLSNAGSLASRTDDSGEEGPRSRSDRRSSLAVSRANSDVDGPSASRASSISIRIRRPQLKQSTSTTSETPSRPKKRRIVDSPSDDSLSPPNTSHFAQSSTSLQVEPPYESTREPSAPLAVPTNDADGYSSSGTSEVPLLQQALNRVKQEAAKETASSRTTPEREDTPADQIENTSAKDEDAPAPSRDETPQMEDPSSRAATPADTPVHEATNPLESEPVRGAGRRRGRPAKAKAAAIARMAKKQTPVPIESKPSGTPATSARSKRAAAATSGLPTPAEVAAQERYVLLKLDMIITLTCGCRSLRHLEYEKQLITEDRHPLYAEAMAELDNVVETRKEQLIRQRDARLRSAIMELEAMERSLWVQWENDKRSLWMEMFHEVLSKDKRLELECKDTDYSKPVLRARQAGIF